MIVFRYTKLDGAEYVSHLDMLRHLNKIMRRAQIPMGYSQGYNPHMHIFMSAPIGVGLKSEAEYCCIESNEDASVFMQKFNQSTFKGLNCVSAVNVSKKISVAGLINRASYEMYGVNHFDVEQILSDEELSMANKKGEVKKIRHKIFDMHFEGEVLCCTLGFGNDTLRADLFLAELVKRFGGKDVDLVKKECFIDETPFDDYLKNLK